MLCRFESHRFVRLLLLMRVLFRLECRLVGRRGMRRLDRTVVRFGLIRRLRCLMEHRQSRCQLGGLWDGWGWFWMSRDWEEMRARRLDSRNRRLLRSLLRRHRRLRRRHRRRMTRYCLPNLFFIK